MFLATSIYKRKENFNIIYCFQVCQKKGGGREKLLNIEHVLQLFAYFELKLGFHRKKNLEAF